jgi:hypothetical protein
VSLLANVTGNAGRLLTGSVDSALGVLRTFSFSAQVATVAITVVGLWGFTKVASAGVDKVLNIWGASKKHKRKRTDDDGDTDLPRHRLRLEAPRSAATAAIEAVQETSVPSAIAPKASPAEATAEVTSTIGAAAASAPQPPAVTYADVVALYKPLCEHVIFVTDPPTDLTSAITSPEASLTDLIDTRRNTRQVIRDELARLGVPLEGCNRKKEELVKALVDALLVLQHKLDLKAAPVTNDK